MWALTFHEAPLLVHSSSTSEVKRSHESSFLLNTMKNHVYSLAKKSWKLRKLNERDYQTLDGTMHIIIRPLLKIKPHSNIGTWNADFLAF